MSLPGGSIGGL